jgi:ArsR family transcriptional regulator, arsenate/arsenite/antimonite-responsive transcriptional repressor
MKDTLKVTKALADGSRLRVVAALTEHKELCVCQITELLRSATPTASRHMSVLQSAGLVEQRKDSRWVYYRLSDTFPTIVLQWLKNTLRDSEEISKDRDTVKAIVACDLDTLCKAQKKRRRH